MATTKPPIHSFSRTTRLPTELVQEIIQFITAPTYSGQYGHDKCVLYTLCQLCLVNHFFHDISAPYLYSSIVVTDTVVQLHALVTTLNASIVLCSYTHSLLIPDFNNYHNYETVIIPWVCDLLDLVNPYLRRLSLCTHDRDIVPTSPMKEVLDRLDRFTDLQEFVGTYSVSSFVWSDWKNLRYLLLSQRPEVTLAFINAISLMPRLTHLGLLIEYWSTPYMLEPHRIIELSKAGGSLQKIIFSFSQTPQIPMQFLRDEFARTPLREGLDVRYLTSNGRNSRLWAWPGSGSFWEADSDSLLAPCADLFDE